jgi:hypothetical protein
VTLQAYVFLDDYAGISFLVTNKGLRLDFA